MAAVLDPHGTAWSAYRDWWPFPGDILDFTDLFALAIVIERDGHEVGRELVRGRRRAKRRVDELALNIASGAVSGPYVI